MTMNKNLAILLATTLSCGTAMPALAQSASAQAAYQDRLDTYRDQRADYSQQVADYDSKQRAYENDRAGYEQSRRDYDRRYGVGAYDRRYPQYATRYSAPAYRDSAAYRSEIANFERDRVAYERDRRNYDRRNGVGSYDRRNPTLAARFSVDGRGYADNSAYDAQRVQWERDRADYERARVDYDRRYGTGSYDRRYPDYAPRYNAPYAGGYNNTADVSYNEPCRQDAKKNAAVGGVIGALAGGVVGSNAAARNAKPEGTVLGALVGAGLGAAIGNASAKSKCDTRGNYWTYDETQPYRETAYNGSRYNSRSDCRLAPAPTEYNGRTETRYVRVCPDSQGRFRVEG